MGVFDPNTFLDVTLNEANDTKLVPVPEGEFPGMCGEPSIRNATSKDGMQQYTFLEVPIEVDSSARTNDGRTIAEVTGRDKNTVRYSASLEFNETGGIDTGKGKNVGLGRLREAVGLNKSGFSFRQLPGRPLKVLVKHRVVDGDIYADVKGVAPIG